MTEKIFEKTFYLIAWYEMRKLRSFIKIGDDKEEITKIFEEKYMWKPNVLGVTEYSYQLLECTATELMNDRMYLDKRGDL